MGKSALNPLNVPIGPCNSSKEICNASLRSVFILFTGGLSGIELKSPIRIRGKDRRLILLILFKINPDDCSLALAPIWSKWVLKTQNSSAVFLSLNKPYVQILSSAASHPTDIVSGVSESQNVESFNTEYRVVSKYIAQNSPCSFPSSLPTPT